MEKGATSLNEIDDILVEILDEVVEDHGDEDIIENEANKESNYKSLNPIITKTERTKFNSRNNKLFSLKSSSFNETSKKFTRPVLKKIPLLPTPLYSYILPESYKNFKTKENSKMVRPYIHKQENHFKKRANELDSMIHKNEENSRMYRPISKQTNYRNKRANESLKKALNLIAKHKTLNEQELKENKRKAYINDIINNYKKFNGTKHGRIITPVHKESIKDENSHRVLSRNSSYSLNHDKKDLKISNIGNLYKKSTEKNSFRVFGDSIQENDNLKQIPHLPTPGVSSSFQLNNNFYPIKMRMPSSPKRIDLYKVNDKSFPENFTNSHYQPVKKYGKYENHSDIPPLLDDYSTHNSGIRMRMPEFPKTDNNYNCSLPNFSARHDHLSHYQPLDKYEKIKELATIQSHSRKYDNLNKIKPSTREIKYGSKLKRDEDFDRSSYFYHHSLPTNSKKFSSSEFNSNDIKKSELANAQRNLCKTERSQKELYMKKRERSYDNLRKRTRQEIEKESYNQNKYIKSDKKYEKSESSKFIDKDDYCSYLRNLGRAHSDSIEKLNERNLQVKKDKSLIKCIEQICTEALLKRQRRGF